MRVLFSRSVLVSGLGVARLGGHASRLFVGSKAQREQATPQWAAKKQKREKRRESDRLVVNTVNEGGGQ
jgi:hypothetical protein